MPLKLIYSCFLLGQYGNGSILMQPIQVFIKRNPIIYCVYNGFMGSGIPERYVTRKGGGYRHSLRSVTHNGGLGLKRAELSVT